MANIYEYRYKCLDENKHISELRYENESSPTTCKTNSSHTIDLSSVSIVEVHDNKTIKIDENITGTGGNFRYRQVNLQGNIKVPGITYQPTINEFQWDYPISVLNLHISPTIKNYDDKVFLSVLSPIPDTPFEFLGYGGIGVLAQDVAVGATAINISSVENTMVGYDLTILSGPTGTTGMTSQHLGEIKKIDKNTNTVFIENSLGTTFLANSIIKQEIYISDPKGGDIGPPQRYPIGEGKIGSSYVPAKSKILVKYYNTNEFSTELKKMHAVIEYMY